MYHPQVYHTGQCDKWDDKDVRRWRCVWKRRCAHAHGRLDARSKEEATEEWKEHIRQAVGSAAAPALIARLTHPQGPQAAGNGTHAASSSLQIDGSEESDGRHGNPLGRQSHVRSVSQPVELVGQSHYGSQQPTAGNFNTSSPTSQQLSMPVQARSHSQQLQLPANSSHNGNGTSLSPTVSPNHSHRGRISPRPLSIPSPVPSNHSSSPNSLPTTPTSASSSVSLSLFDIHSTSDASNRVWGSPHPANGRDGEAGSVDDSALHRTVGWNAPKPMPVARNLHRRSVTMNDAATISESYWTGLGQMYSRTGSSFAPSNAPLALHLPSSAGSSSSQSAVSSSSASPSHLVPRNLFSTTSSLHTSLNSSQVTSPTDRQAGGRKVAEVRRVDGLSDEEAMGGGDGNNSHFEVDGAVVRQLAGMLICPFSTSACSARPHVLHQPVLMPCCGVAVCGRCANLYVMCNEGKSCSCGHHYNDWERQQLHALPPHRLLHQITGLVSSGRDDRG